MDTALALMEAGDVRSAMDRLCHQLLERRKQLSPRAWKEFISTQALTHPIRRFVHEDPFTFRAFSKPRGYAGDAVMIDYIYGTAETRTRKDVLTEAIHRCTTSSPPSRAVRHRRVRVADCIDDVSAARDAPRVLALAAGHLREADIAESVRSGSLADFVALDQDPESLAVVSRCYGRFGVRTVTGCVSQLVRRPLSLGAFDLVYATGLFDYLTQPFARRLTQVMFHGLRPGGVILIPNFLPGVNEVGYMEAFMDWRLVYRTDEDMLDLLSAVPRSEIASVCLSHDPDENMVYMQVKRTVDRHTGSTAARLEDE